MPQINLRDLYPYYKSDCFIDIPDEILDELEDCNLEEETYQRYMRYHKARTSLDKPNRKTESQIVDKPPMPHEIFDEKLTIVLLHQAIAQLPDKHAKRIYAYFFLRMSKKEIAKAEKVTPQTVRRSINEGICLIRKYLQKNL